MVPAAERKGPLWDWYRELLTQGWKLDANSYSTAFRLTNTPGKTAEDLKAAIGARPSSLACTFNLGTADFYPTTSGKGNAARHLMARFGMEDTSKSAFLCDDDNDLPLAALVGKAFLPSISSVGESVQQAVQQHPERFVTATSTWTAGTEEMLDAALAYLASDSVPQSTAKLDPVTATA
jgi:hydroxymethylpyrimidine pyrophosphatase-like HAD family hydrolase